MKLLLLSTSSSRNAGGLYNSVRNLGQALMKEDGVEPGVIAFTDEKSAQDRAAYAPLPLVEYNIIGPAGLAFSFELKRKIEDFRPDIIHTQGIYLYSSFINRQYAKQNKIPYLISPRGMLDKWILHSNPWKKKIGFALYERAHLNNAACLHALGIPEFKAIREFGCKNPVAIIPNGVFLPEPRSLEHLTPPLWKTADNRKVLLFLSRLHPKKGIENLLKAYAKMNESKKSWKVIIAGESNGPAYLEDLVTLQKKLNLEHDVLFIGPQFHADKDQCFRFADAFILPSYSEGMPMAVLEAWSYSLPTLITEECNLPEGFTENAAIRIAPNVDSILTGLERLFSLTNQELAILGENGCNLVKKKFTWDSIAKQMLDLYKWILGKGPMPDTVKIS